MKNLKKKFKIENWPILHKISWIENGSMIYWPRKIPGINNNMANIPILTKIGLFFSKNTRIIYISMEKLR